MTMEPSAEDTMEAVLDLSPEEARTYSMILDAASTLPKSDPRFSLTLTFTWWLLQRRRRLEQQRVRRRQFYRRLRRLIFLRWHMNRMKVSGVAVAKSVTQAAVKEELIVPEKRLWVRTDRNEDFWTKVDRNLISPEIFRRYFHMSRETFDYVYDELADQLQKSNTTMRDPLPGKKRLAATLYRMATNAEYIKVASLFGIGKSTTTSLVREVCDVIVANLKDKFLTFIGEGLMTEDKRRKIEEAAAKFGIPRVIGVLGSIDVLIIGSSWDWSESSPYISSYHKNYAVTFQTVVDSDGRFSHVVAGSPSSLTNKQILESCCDLRDEFLLKFQSGIGMDGDTSSEARLVSDESYAGEDETENPDEIAEFGQLPKNSEWLLTPLELEGEVEDDNEKQLLEERISQAQGIFDDAIFKVKSRWKIFHGKGGKINFSADAFEKIALACCILHNICELKEDGVDQSWGDEVGPEVYNRRGIPKDGSPSRDATTEENHVDDEVIEEEEEDNQDNEMDITPVDVDPSLLDADSEMILPLSGGASVASIDAADIEEMLGHVEGGDDDEEDLPEEILS